ncbi:MAG TPA: isoamylase early set domain-containing protein [Longimicrobiales bacterium]|jgi:1,4-alpha-glucan branching enzyme
MVEKRPNKKDDSVRVTFVLPADIEAQTVHLLGDFTGWQAVAMKRHKNGTWRATLNLSPGQEYQYRYLADGVRWINDPAADRYVDNPFGEQNCIVVT